MHVGLKKKKNYIIKMKNKEKIYIYILVAIQQQQITFFKSSSIR